MTGYAPAEEMFDFKIKINSTDFATNDTYQNFTLLVSRFGNISQEFNYNLSMSKNGVKKKFWNEFFTQDVFSSEKCLPVDMIYKNGLFYVFGICQNLVNLDSKEDIFVYILDEKGEFENSFFYDSVGGNRNYSDSFEVGFVGDLGEIFVIDKYSSSTERIDYEVIKFDKDGQILNVFNFSNDRAIEFKDVLLSENYFYLVSKKYNELGLGSSPFIQKINLKGDIVLNKTFTDISKGGFLGIKKIGEDDFFVYGDSEYLAYDLRIFSYRLNSNLEESSFIQILEEMDSRYFRSTAFDDLNNMYAIFASAEGVYFGKYSLEGERIFVNKVSNYQIFSPYLFFDKGNIYLNGFFGVGDRYDPNYEETLKLQEYDLDGDLSWELIFEDVERESDYTNEVVSSLFVHNNLYLLWDSSFLQNLIFKLQENVLLGPFEADSYNIYVGGESYFDLFNVFDYETSSNDFYEFEVSGIGSIDNSSKLVSSFLVRNDLFEIVSSGDLEFPINEWGEFKYKIRCLLGNCSKVVSDVFSLGGTANIVSFFNDALNKASYPGCVVDGSCDCITENICLAKSLFPPVNIVTQGIPENPTCDTDGVLWTVGECSSAVGFGNFCDLMNGISSEEEFISRVYCIHVLETNKYYDIKFNEIGLGFSSEPNYLMSYTRELYEGDVIEVLSFDLLSDNSSELELYLNFSSSEVYDVNEGEVEVIIPVYSNQIIEKNLTVVAKIQDKPLIKKEELFTISFEDSLVRNDTQEDDSGSSSSGGGYVLKSGNFEINFSSVGASLKSGETETIYFDILNDGDLEYKLNVYFNGIADFVFDDTLVLDLKRGLNKYSFDLVASDSVVKGNYNGEVVFGAPLVESVNFSVSLFEEIVSNQTKDEKEEKIVVSKGGASSGSFIEFPVRIGYFDKNKYLNENMKIDYSIVDNDGNKVYEGNSSFVAGNDFDYNVNLKAPSDLDSGEYKVNTRIKTPDNYEILGEHTLVIEEEGDKEIPFWPSFITVFIIVFLAGLLWWLLTKDKDDDRDSRMDS